MERMLLGQAYKNEFWLNQIHILARKHNDVQHLCLGKKHVQENYSLSEYL